MKKFIIIFILLLLIGCSSITKKDIGIGLMTAKDTVITTGTIAKHLCEQGILSDKDCKKAKELYTQARKILIQSENIWEDMIDKDSLARLDDYNRSLDSAMVIMAEIEKIIRRNK